MAIELLGHRGRENLVHMVSGLVQDEAEVLGNSRVVAGQAVEYEDLGRSISVKKEFTRGERATPAKMEALTLSVHWCGGHRPKSSDWR